MYLLADSPPYQYYLLLRKALFIFVHVDYYYYRDQ